MYILNKTFDSEDKGSLMFQNIGIHLWRLLHNLNSHFCESLTTYVTNNMFGTYFEMKYFFSFLFHIVQASAILDFVIVFIYMLLSYTVSFIGS
jgi:hypothetical protein